MHMVENGLNMFERCESQQETAFLCQEMILCTMQSSRAAAGRKEALLAAGLFSMQCCGELG